MSKLWTVLEKDDCTTTYAMDVPGGVVIRTHTAYDDTRQATFSSPGPVKAAAESTVFIPGASIKDLKGA